jgi:hypothetical protein
MGAPGPVTDIALWIMIGAWIVDVNLAFLTAEGNHDGSGDQLLRPRKPED